MWRRPAAGNVTYYIPYVADICIVNHRFVKNGLAVTYLLGRYIVIYKGEF